MVKAPVMGLVKTRLAREIGRAAAVAAYRTMIADTLRRLGRDRRWRIVLAVAPDSSVATRAFPAAVRRLKQGQGDLGVRMQRVFDALRNKGPVLLIGSDIPGIAPHHIALAFHALEAHDAVLGPAPDGGYWAVGIGRRRRLTPFALVRWSTPEALSGTLANMKGARVALVDELPDVDTAAEWRAWTRLPPSRRLQG
jgi:uncharacterized protein